MNEWIVWQETKGVNLKQKEEQHFPSQTISFFKIYFLDKSGGGSEGKGRSKVYRVVLVAVFKVIMDKPDNNRGCSLW